MEAWQPRSWRRNIHARLVGAETGSRGREDSRQGGGGLGQGKATAGGQDFPYLLVDKLEEQLGSETNCATQGSSTGNTASTPLAVKTCGMVVVGETPTLTGESLGESHVLGTSPISLQHAQAHPPGNQHLKRYNLLVGSEGSDRKWGNRWAN